MAQMIQNHKMSWVWTDEWQLEILNFERLSVWLFLLCFSIFALSGVQKRFQPSTPTFQVGEELGQRTPLFHCNQPYPELMKNQYQPQNPEKSIHSSSGIFQLHKTRTCDFVPIFCSRGILFCGWRRKPSIACKKQRFLGYTGRMQVVNFQSLKGGKKLRRLWNMICVLVVGCWTCCWCEQIYKYVFFMLFYIFCCCSLSYPGAILGRRDGRWLPMFNPCQKSHFNGKGSPFGEQTADQEIDKSCQIYVHAQCESRGTTGSGAAGVWQDGSAGGQRYLLTGGAGLGYQVVERCGWVSEQ